MRKRKVTYPVARTATKRAPRGLDGEVAQVRPTLATIDLTAGGGRAGLAVGDRVRIMGTGLFAGETAVIERLTVGAIPGALVRTEAGRSRQVRAIDLEPIVAEG